MSECIIHIELVGSTVTLTRIRFSFKIRLHISVLKEEQWDVDFQNAIMLLNTLHTRCSISALLTASDWFVQFLLHFIMVLFYKTKPLKKKTKQTSA